MSAHHSPTRSLVRRFTLGSGPLKRGSDRLELASRMLLLLVLLVSAPVGIAVGTGAAQGLAVTADLQAAARHQVRATLLEDADASSDPAALTVTTAATWAGADGTSHEGRVLAPIGARVGSSVTVWVNHRDQLVPAPLTGAAVADQAVVIGVVTFLGIVIAGLGGHLGFVWLLGRHRARRWAAGWALVEPLWVSRFR